MSFLRSLGYALNPNVPTGAPLFERVRSLVLVLTWCAATLLLLSGQAAASAEALAGYAALTVVATGLLKHDMGQ